MILNRTPNPLVLLFLLRYQTLHIPGAVISGPICSSVVVPVIAWFAWEGEIESKASLTRRLDLVSCRRVSLMDIDYRCVAHTNQPLLLRYRLRSIDLVYMLISVYLI